MRRVFIQGRLLIWMVAAAVLAASAFASAQTGQTDSATACRLPERVAPAVCPDRGPPRGRAGDFDYYVLALSWSPEYCADRGQRDAHQCAANRFGFVVHGLWPQYRPRGPEPAQAQSQAQSQAQAAGTSRPAPPWPQYCAPADPLPEALVRRHLCQVPSPRLMACQWSKHGSCGDFAGPAAYFAAIEEILARVRRPDLPAGSSTVRAIRAAFAAVNPGLAGEHMAVLVAHDHLSEVRICLARDRTSFVRCDAAVGGSAPDRRLKIR